MKPIADRFLERFGKKSLIQNKKVNEASIDDLGQIEKKHMAVVEGLIKTKFSESVDATAQAVKAMSEMCGEESPIKKQFVESLDKFTSSLSLKEGALTVDMDKLEDEICPVEDEVKKEEPVKEAEKEDEVKKDEIEEEDDEMSDEEKEEFEMEEALMNENDNDYYALMKAKEAKNEEDEEEVAKNKKEEIV